MDFKFVELPRKSYTTSRKSHFPAHFQPYWIPCNFIIYLLSYFWNFEYKIHSKRWKPQNDRKKRRILLNFPHFPRPVLNSQFSYWYFEFKICNKGPQNPLCSLTPYNYTSIWGFDHYLTVGTTVRWWGQNSVRLIVSQARHPLNNLVYKLLASLKTRFPPNFMTCVLDYFGGWIL